MPTKITQSAPGQSYTELIVQEEIDEAYTTVLDALARQERFILLTLAGGYSAGKRTTIIADNVITMVEV